jgi:hypothetical protein
VWGTPFVYYARLYGKPAAMGFGGAKEETARGMAEADARYLWDRYQAMLEKKRKEEQEKEASAEKDQKK